MAAATRYLAALLLCAIPLVASAEDPRITDLKVGMGVYSQSGAGYQSQATGPDGLGRGSEDALIFQPQTRIRVEQSETVSHDIALTVDVVSAASPDAVDAVSQASKWQESAGVRGQTTVRKGDKKFLGRYGYLWEENLSSFRFGGEVQLSLADDNAALSFSVDGIHDIVNDYRRDGRRINDYSRRTTVSANAFFSQVLSTTAIAWLGYGATVQRGNIATPFNTTPIDSGGRYKERFPNERLRHALSGRLAQRIVATDSTLRVGYRFYVDDFDIMANTAEVELYQDLGAKWVARAFYRLHHQTAAEFYAESFPRVMAEGAPRTSDSDLSRFWSNEVGGTVRYAFESNHPLFRGVSIDATYFHYWRTNGLTVGVSTLGYQKQF